jgi:hypothetical protein
VVKIDTEELYAELQLEQSTTLIRVYLLFLSRKSAVIYFLTERADFGRVVWSQLAL